MKQVLLVEDDLNLGFVIKDNLEMNGFCVKHCTDGEMAIQTFNEHLFDLCVLDVMLPKKDGFNLAQEIRQQNEWVPILFLTAKGLKEDKIAGFKAGGDDYIVKPFSIEELILRMEVFLRRTSQTPAFTQKNDIILLGKYEFDYKNLVVCFNGSVKNLTQKEADVLLFFSKNQNQVLKREEILKAVWGNDDYFLGRSMDVFISKLRKYLQEDSNIEIQNLHGIGFRFEVK